MDVSSLSEDSKAGSLDNRGGYHDNLTRPDTIQKKTVSFQDKALVFWQKGFILPSHWEYLLNLYRNRKIRVEMASASVLDEVNVYQTVRKKAYKPIEVNFLKIDFETLLNLIVP